MKKRLLFLSIFIGISSIVIGGISFHATQNNRYKEAVAIEGDFVPDQVLPESYRINNEFTVPSGKISYEGNLYNYTDYYLEYPDGKTYKKDKYVLNITGKYNCHFVHTSSNLEVFSNYSFYVYNNAYSMNNEESYATYTNAIPTNAKPTPGITVSLMENDMFTYNQVVDISNASLDEPIIKYHPYAQSIRANPSNADKDMSDGATYEFDDPNKPKPLSTDAKCSVVRVTDAYDPSIYFESFIYYRTANTSNNRQQQYAVVGASNQNKVGIEEANAQGTGNRLVTIDGVSYREYIGLTSTGFGITLNTCSGTLYEYRPNSSGGTDKRAIGTTNNVSTTADISNADDYGYSIYYDAKTMKVYIKHHPSKLCMVNDLDEPILHGTNLFPGFTTGEVFISIYGSEYQQTRATYDIESIYSISDLDADKVIDNTPPVIELDNDEENFNIAVNEEFHLFNAKVIDYNFDNDLSTYVYYEYGTPQQSQVNVSSNNTFVPKKAGKYTIVYKAVDRFNNVSTKEVNLYAIKTSTNKIIDFEVEEINEIDAGQEIVLPTPDIVVYNNKPIIHCYAIFEDGEIINIDPNNWKLFLKKVGTYEIHYEYGDGISNYEYHYVLNAKTSDKVYLEEVSFPKYAIKDAAFSIDNARVVKVDNKEPSYASPEVYISEDSGEFNKKVDIKNVSTTANNTIQFQYRYDNKVIYTSDLIPVKEVNFKNNKIDKKLYFDNENVETDAGSSYITLSANKNGESTFINSLNFSAFRLMLDLNSSKLDKCKLDIVFTDYEDDNNTFTVTLWKKEEGKTINVSFNGIMEVSVNQSSYSLSYNSLKQLLSDSFDNNLEMTNPFNSDRFYLSFAFKEVKGDSSIAIRNINDQPMNKALGDTKAPNINAPKIEGRHSLGSTISLDFFYPDDTFSPYLEGNYYFYVTYYETEEDYENGEYVTSTSGVLLDSYQDINQSYSFVLDKIGIYEVFYSYKDQAGHDSATAGLKLIYSVDDTPPTIKLDGGYDFSTVVLASVGSTHVVKGCHVEDDVDNNVKTVVYVLSPSLVWKKLDGNSFELKEKGDYHVYYYATDSSGNVSTAHYVVRVN